MTRRKLSSERPTVLLADDHQPFLQSLRRLLDLHFEVLGAVADGEALIREAARLRPHIVVADFSMAPLDGIGATRRLKQELGLDLEVVILSFHRDRAVWEAARAAGAIGYVWKGSVGDDIVPAIECALEKRPFLSAALLGE